jgi:hypothetical protein
MAEFRIGIDLGTTNCALAWTRMDDPDGGAQIFPVAQLVGSQTSAESRLLPSFLALPPGASDWIPGQHARALAPELTGRVISSAKSWFVHHAVDRRAAFLPLGKEEIPADRKLSPLQASQALLQHLRACWDDAHPGAPLRDQQVAVTVPASFDPVAQQLTLEAAYSAGFPDCTLLIEEPQAAFYARPTLETTDEISSRDAGDLHILVIDIGGGTSDFSLFHRNEAGHLRRVAVGEHILLGGDNLDLALAHALEEKCSPSKPLPPSAFNRLVSRAREIKEAFFSGEGTEASEEIWPVAIALPGSSLLRGTLRTEISRSELLPLLLDGFFPLVGRRETPLQKPQGLREMGLPYAHDPAITRHLAAFLRGRPPIRAVFFNGGTTKSPVLRGRILSLIAQWQEGVAPVEWENPEPDCAVALGAARFLHLRAHGKAIESGAARACYLGVGKREALCILPQGTPPDSPQQAAPSGLHATLGQPVSFPLYQHSRRPEDEAGRVVTLDETFQSLPSLETILMPPRNGRKARQAEVRVGLRTLLRSTGVLQVELLCLEHSLKWQDPWRLEFVIRDAQTASSSLRSLPPETISRAADALRKVLGRRTNTQPTGNFLLGIAEKELSQERNAWGAGTVRFLFDQLAGTPEVSDVRAENGAALCQLMSFLLRPGRGVPGDSDRVKKLLPLLIPDGANVPKALRLQQWVALRRISAGIDAQDAGRIWSSLSEEWSALLGSGKVPPTELFLLVSSLDALPREVRAMIAGHLRSLLCVAPDNEMLWRALGRILSRFLFHAGADQILPPSEVDAAWQDLGGLRIADGTRKEAAACWLRAARRTGLREVDASSEVRKGMDRLLRSWNVDEVRRHVLHDIVPLAEADQSRLLGETPPPGLQFESTPE